MRIITNNTPRFTLDACELTEKERKEFDYLNWEAIDKGEGYAEFFRYKGQLYDIGEFMRMEEDDFYEPHPDAPDGLFKGWQGYSPQSAFNAILIKWPNNGNDMDSVIVGQYFS